MDPRKWLPKTPLLGSYSCVYCGGIANTSDHTPPRCLLPRKLPADIQAMTVPACKACNAAFATDEMRAAAIIYTVSFIEEDRQATSPRGWMHAAMQRDRSLRVFIEERWARMVFSTRTARS